MVEKFFPDLFVKRIEDINFETLLKNNIRGMILDIDNTLVPPDVMEADERAVKWLTRANEKGIKMCLVSNNSEDRVITFNRDLKLPAIHSATKPRKKSFIEAVKLLGLEPGEVSVVGDQIFTDVFGGNRLNLFTILVSPISEQNENLFIRFKRLLELKILRDYRKYNPGLEQKRSKWKKKSGAMVWKQVLENENK